MSTREYDEGRHRAPSYGHAGTEPDSGRPSSPVRTAMRPMPEPEEEVPSPVSTTSDTQAAAASAPAASALVAVGLVVGAALALVDPLLGTDGGTAMPWLGALGGGLVVGVLTAVLAHRVVGAGWTSAAVVGAIAGLGALGGSYGPSWLILAVVVYTIAASGTVAVVVTRSVRGLTALVVEYVLALGVALAGAGAVSGLLGEVEPSFGVTGAAVVAALGMALLAATWVRARLADDSGRVREYAYVGAFILAVLVAASAVTVILVNGGWSWMRTSAGLVTLVALAFALLGVGAAARAWTPAGWWVSAPAALGTATVSIAVATGSVRTVGAAVLGVGIGYLAGVVSTVGVAMLIGMILRSQRGRRPRWRAADEPNRLAVLR